MNVALKRFAWPVFIWLAVICDSSGALDLNPQFVQMQVNGNRFDCPYFLDGKTRYSAHFPARTSICGDKGGAFFMFSEPQGATLAMRPSTVSPQTPFREPDLQIYRKALLSFVAAHATDVKIEKQEVNPRSKCLWNICRFTVSSSLPGMRIMQEITFLNFSATQQIVLITTADASTFGQAADNTLQILNTFRSIPAGVDLAAPALL